MTESGSRSQEVSRHVGAAAEAVLRARGEARMRVFERSHVPMVMVDGTGRYAEVNRPARLWFRLSAEELRTFRLGDLTPAPLDGQQQQQLALSRLFEARCVVGRYPVYGVDGARRDVVYCALANILPGLHLIAFAPADWPDHELVPLEHDGADASVSLTEREIELLALAADGLSGPELAEKLFLSPATVHKHFDHIYAKLDVRTRAAAVAKAMRLGVIE